MLTGVLVDDELVCHQAIKIGVDCETDTDQYSYIMKDVAGTY